jgi:lysine 6-dehydrogenase
MKVTVLGTGMIGKVIVKELALLPGITRVVAVDGQQAAVDACLAFAGSAKVQGRVADLGDPDVLVDVMTGSDAAIAALPHALSLSAVEAAIQAKCHLVDLVGSRYPEKVALHERARAAGILVVVGCGVAPGILNVLTARGVELLDEAEDAVMYCGGLPRHPQPPLWYQVVFRLESVMGLYTRPALALEQHALVQRPPLSGLESCTFPEPVGECEAVYSDAHSVAYTLRGKVRRLSEKTVRYKGHFAKMGVLAELGFLSDEPVSVDGSEVRPRRLALALLEPQLQGGPEQDITVLRAIVTGKKGGNPARFAWEMVDVYDGERRYTSMGKTTGVPAVIAVEWLLLGRLPERGVLTPEELFVGERFELFLAALRGRGVVVTASA